MKSTMEMRVDTTWGNQIILTVESELDNPHLITTKEISTLMVHTLRISLDEVRAENDRYRLEDEARPDEEEVFDPQRVVAAERERERFQAMERGR